MKTYLFLIILYTPFILNAQEYKTDIGTRGGESWGFTYRIYSDETNAEEALLSFRDGGMQLTALKEMFMPVLLKYSEHFFLYKGYGGHLGFSRWHHKNYDKGNYIYNNQLKVAPLLGIDGVAGLEYRLFKYPFSAGIEYKPFAELGGRRFFRLNLWDFGLTVKYSFN